MSHSQLPQAGPYGASEPRVSPPLASRDVLDPHQSQCVTRPKSTGVGTPQLRVPRWRAALDTARGQRCGAPQAHCPCQERFPAGGGDGALLPQPWHSPRGFGRPWPTQPHQEPSWLSGLSLLWLYLLVPLCTLRVPSSWGLGRWGYSGEPALSTAQGIHIRGKGWEPPRGQEQRQGAGDARLCQLSAGTAAALQRCFL